MRRRNRSKGMGFAMAEVLSMSVICFADSKEEKQAKIRKGILRHFRTCTNCNRQRRVRFGIPLDMQPSKILEQTCLSSAQQAARE